MTYTLIAVVVAVAVVGLDLAVARTRLLLRKAFWTSYAIVLAFQLIVNGILTGVPVVRYDPGAIIGIRFAYAPVEDLIFGFSMVVLTLTSWVWLGRRTGDRAGSTTR